MSKNTNLNKRVLVTGASRGIGKAIALHLAQSGFSLSINFRSDLKSAESLATEIEKLSGASPELLQFDVGDRQAALNCLEKSLAERGAFYGVVLNAGVYKDAPFVGFEDSDWDNVLRTNLDGFYNVLRPLTMPMIQLRQGGRIVVMSSLSGITGNRGQVNYSASKAGLIGAAKSLSKELAKRKISVNCVAPGFIESEMTQELDTSAFVATIPMQRAGKPEEVAALVDFLFTPKAEYITGQVISINGGML